MIMVIVIRLVNKLGFYYLCLIKWGLVKILLVNSDIEWGCWIFDIICLCNSLEKK